MSLTKTERIAIAQAAERLRQELQPVLEALEADYKTRWANEPLAAEREVLWHRQQALRDVAREIAGRITDGRIAEEEMNNDR